MNNVSFITVIPTSTDYSSLILDADIKGKLLSHKKIKEYIIEMAKGVNAKYVSELIDTYTPFVVDIKNLIITPLKSSKENQIAVELLNREHLNFEAIKNQQEKQDSNLAIDNILKKIANIEIF